MRGRVVISWWSIANGKGRVFPVLFFDDWEAGGSSLERDMRDGRRMCLDSSRAFFLLGSASHALKRWIIGETLWVNFTCETKICTLPPDSSLKSWNVVRSFRAGNG